MHDRGTLPLVAVPFMGDAGRRLCEAEGVSWIDLSGNARIVAPGVRIIIEGKPNRYVRRGRPSSAFAPKSSRIARWILMHEGEPLTQRELARATGMDEGYLSKVVRRLEDERLLVRDDRGGLRARDPNLLLDAWDEAHDFAKHEVLKGHVAGSSGLTRATALARMLRKEGVQHATTGLVAAWLWAPHAEFRLVSFYLNEEPSPALLEALSFREEERGANTWLVIPRDEGVFHGASRREGISVVHPVQAYVDLAGHPERAPEAAEELRGQRLRWEAGD